MKDLTIKVEFKLIWEKWKTSNSLYFHGEEVISLIEKAKKDFPSKIAIDSHYNCYFKDDKEYLKEIEKWFNKWFGEM